MHLPCDTIHINNSDDDDGLALKLGLGLGAARVACLGLTAMSYSKERKTNKQDQQADVR
jgi:hypothetical protein